MPLPPSPSDESDRAAKALAATSRHVVPTQEQRKIIKRNMLRQVSAPHALLRAKEELKPAKAQSSQIWQAILSRIAPLHTEHFWEKLRSLSSASDTLKLFLRRKLLRRLEPVSVSSFMRIGGYVVAFGVFLLVLRASPMLFLAPHSRAASSVVLIPVQGEVSVLRDGLWQPLTGQMTLKGAVRIRTGEASSVTLIVRDDGVLRLGENTIVDVPDFPDSSQGKLAALPEEFGFESGTLWIQALMPESAPGWMIDAAGAHVAIHEGSLSMQGQTDRVALEVWDRLASVFETKGNEVALVSGDGLTVRSGENPSQGAVTVLAEQSPWVIDNLKRDAVHRSEVALLQQERLAKNAGILPTSPLYPVKRVAEAVDMMLTFGSSARTQKLLDQADTRLNEAAALLASGSGSQAAQNTLQEYKTTLLAAAVATGSGAQQDLLNQQLTSDVADVSAALPSDASYLLKKTVLEAGASLPGSQLKPEDVMGTLLVDALSSITHQAQEGDAPGSILAFKSLSSSIALLDDSSSRLSSKVRKEARASLTVLARTIEQSDRSGGTGTVLASSGLERYLPSPVGVGPIPLTDAEVDAYAQAIKSRIFLYKMPRSRYDQLLAESRALDSNPDQGRILRRLYYILPPNGLAQYVRTEFQRIRKDKGGII